VSDQTTSVLVKPVINAVRIVRYLNRNSGSARASQLSRDLAINPSTCFNILRTLVAENVLSFDAVTKAYCLTEGMLSFADASAVEYRQLSYAAPVLRQLAQTHQVTATLWRRITPERLILAAIEHGPMDLRIDIPPRQRLPSLIGATGRLIAAQPNSIKDDIEKMFNTLRWARPLTFQTYWKQSLLAANRGWAVDEGFFKHGILSVAAPVRDLQGCFSLSISLLAFMGQYQGEDLERLGEAVKQSACHLAEMLYRPNDP
jgi:DNA-binding IclR family transcriptional regulator